MPQDALGKKRRGEDIEHPAAGVIRGLLAYFLNGIFVQTQDLGEDVIGIFPGLRRQDAVALVVDETDAIFLLHPVQRLAQPLRGDKEFCRRLRYRTQVHCADKVLHIIQIHRQHTFLV